MDSLDSEIKKKTMNPELRESFAEITADNNAGFLFNYSVH